MLYCTGRRRLRSEGANCSSHSEEEGRSRRRSCTRPHSRTLGVAPRAQTSTVLTFRLRGLCFKGKGARAREDRAVLYWAAAYSWFRPAFGVPRLMVVDESLNAHGRSLVAAPARLEAEPKMVDYYGRIGVGISPHRFGG